MRTYWDLSEKERAGLSREDVEAFCDAELMTKGVLRVQALELERLPPVPEPATTHYEVRQALRAMSSDIVFRSPDDAAAFLALRPLYVNSDYVNGDFLKSVRELEAPEIIAVKMHTTAELDACKADMLRKVAVEKENRRREREHAEAVKKQEDALRGMWDDWYGCQDKAHRMRRVVDTFGDYVRIAGGERDVAGVFLSKVFDHDEIAAASEWTGIEIPTALEPQVNAG